MAAKTHSALFFERFLAFNLDRYKNNAEMLAKFTGLTEADVTITDITEIAQPVAGSRRSTVTSLGRNFHGIQQDWTPAVAQTKLKLYILQNEEEPLAALADLADQTAAGAYVYLDGGVEKVGIVIGSDVDAADFATAVEATLRAALVYDIPTVNVPDGGTTVVLTGDTFNGALEWAQGSEPVVEIPPTYYGDLGDEFVPS